VRVNRTATPPTLICAREAGLVGVALEYVGEEQADQAPGQTVDRGVVQARRPDPHVVNERFPARPGDVVVVDHLLHGALRDPTPRRHGLCLWLIHPSPCNTGHTVFSPLRLRLITRPGSRVVSSRMSSAVSRRTDLPVWAWMRPRVRIPFLEPMPANPPLVMFAGYADANAESRCSTGNRTISQREHRRPAASSNHPSDAISGTAASVAMPAANGASRYRRVRA